MKVITPIRQQQGLVLFIALIALVVMSLAAVALIRSVDSATMIAGNLAFKQSATNAGESALMSANQWIESQAVVDPPTGLDNDNLAVGYYATSTSIQTLNGFEQSMSSYDMLTTDRTWEAGKVGVAQMNCAGVVGTVDCAGNQVNYVIERMCALPGAANGGLALANQQCLYGPVTDNTSSQTVKDLTTAETPVTAGASPMYRITARVSGPKNTFSYIQVFVY